MALEQIFTNKKALNVYQNLMLESRESKHMSKCLFIDCGKETLKRSHIIQNNKFLNQISEDQHLTTFRINNFFTIQNKGIIDFRESGINETLSLPLFCGEHDNNVFDYIEKPNIFIEDYYSVLLLNYRTICAEIRKKLFNFHFGISLIEHPFLSEFLTIQDREYIKKCISRDQIALDHDLDPVRIQLEGEIVYYGNNRNFHFGLEFCYEKFERIDVCASAILSYFPNNDYYTKEIPGCLFIHILPFEEYTLKISSIHSMFSNHETLEAFNKWNLLSNDNFQRKLSFSMLNKFETWALKPSFYNSLNPELKNFMKSEFANSINNELDEKHDYNLFNHGSS